MNFLLQVRPFKILPTALLTLASITFSHPSQDRVDASDQGFSGTYTVEADRIVAPLTKSPGIPSRGRQIVAGRDGNCLACHTAPIPEEQFHGNLGPDLSQVGSYYDEAQLRLRLVDPKQLNPETIMPAFFKTTGLNRVGKKYTGRPILNAQQIEDVIAYLLTLKDKEP